jgi:hypothetical protein
MDYILEVKDVSELMLLSVPGTRVLVITLDL